MDRHHLQHSVSMLSVAWASGRGCLRTGEGSSFGSAHGRQVVRHREVDAGRNGHLAQQIEPSCPHSRSLSLLLQFTPCPLLDVHVLAGSFGFQGQKQRA